MVADATAVDVMVADAMAGSRLIGMIQPLYSDTPKPPLSDVGTLGNWTSAAISASWRATMPGSYPLSACETVGRGPPPNWAQATPATATRPAATSAFRSQTPRMFQSRNWRSSSQAGRRALSYR